MADELARPLQHGRGEGGRGGSCSRCIGSCSRSRLAGGRGRGGIIAAGGCVGGSCRCRRLCCLLCLQGLAPLCTLPSSPTSSLAGSGAAQRGGGRQRGQAGRRGSTSRWRQWGQAGRRNRDRHKYLQNACTLSAPSFLVRHLLIPLHSLSLSPAHLSSPPLPLICLSSLPLHPTCPCPLSLPLTRSFCLPLPLICSSPPPLPLSLSLSLSLSFSPAHLSIKDGE